MCTHVSKCKNDTFETLPAMREGMKNSSGGGNSNMIYLIQYKNLCKCECHSVPPLSTTIKKKKVIFMLGVWLK
jgi:hypothetical protein